MSDRPAKFDEEYGPRIDSFLKGSNPEMPDEDRKAAVNAKLSESWPKLSEKKRAEFMPKETRKPEGGDFDSMFDTKFPAVPVVKSFDDMILDLLD
jgi:hypothetical protein